MAGAVYASATMENYWNSKQGYNKYYQIGYSNNFWRFNYSISAGRSKRPLVGSKRTSTLGFPCHCGTALKPVRLI
jgi:outer membrane usher protein FimD/PapC